MCVIITIIIMCVNYHAIKSFAPCSILKFMKSMQFYRV